MNDTRLWNQKNWIQILSDPEGSRSMGKAFTFSRRVHSFLICTMGLAVGLQEAMLREALHYAWRVSVHTLSINDLSIILPRILVVKLDYFY